MSLATLNEVMEPREEPFAVGAFNTFDFSTALGVVEGAERAGMAVIAMMGTPVLNVPGNENLARFLVTLAEQADVPVVVHLDHAKDIETCVKAINLGFSSVMIDGSALPLEENINLTRNVLDVARSAGVSVEAELGALAGTEDSKEIIEQKMTDPTHVKTFLEAVDVDGLAVSIGNVHGFYKGEPHLNFPLLEKLKEISDVPLILHGGTGLTNDQFARAIQQGIKKVNIGTEIKKVTIETFIETHRKNEPGWDMIGIPRACREAVVKVVCNYLQFYRYGWKDYA
jgi:fructose-bisphosphate aldolase, class II